MMKNKEIIQILDFWFGQQSNQLASPEKQKMWYGSTTETDKLIAVRFFDMHHKASLGHLDSWAESAPGCLALVILLDQMSRNLFRGDARAFAFDPLALRWCLHGIECGYLQTFTLTEKLFFIHPLEHSESLADQRHCVALMEGMGEGLNGEQLVYLNKTIAFAKEHQTIIEQFGRFPHRNTVLGRENTPEEAQYLAEGGKRFGQ